MSARFSNAINTDFEFKNSQLQYPLVYNKLLRHSKVHNIAQHSKESTYMNKEMTSFAPEDFFFGGKVGKLVSPDRQIHTQVSSFYLLRD